MSSHEVCHRLMRSWRHLLVGLVSGGLVLAACSNPAGVSNKAGVAAPQGEPTADALVGYFTINVDMADNGIQPPSIFIPAGRRVQLVMRNRGSTEHHFRVLGLVPQDPLWLARARPGISDEEHMEHHSGASFVDATRLMLFDMCSSAAGICPKGNEVHAYAAARGMDVVLFTATKTGTFLVQCPLHREVVGKVTVF